MDDYIVSARKYRPLTFDSVVGQGALTTTLKNAIKQGKLANAYLFCGPRGVGKTTCARIFAKTINCTNPKPDGEACGECESCRSFNEEMRSYNVFELDAASNNSVEDIRNLTEQVRIPPMNGKYKVYIIDEVHMLSSAAFNAFLKTLEEPPHYAIFILATTEKHKIIPTILSRCQTYDFGRITNADIVAHLKSVAQKEGVTADDRALAVIAEKSDGGMRDALSIFDQTVSFTHGSVTYEKTLENLGIIDSDCYFRLTDMLLEKRIPDSLLLLDNILSRGFDGSHLIGGLMLHVRNLLVSKDASTLPLLQTSDDMRKRYQEQAAKCQPKFLYRTLKICNDCDLNYRISKNKRLLIELALIQAAQADEDDDSSGRKPGKLKPIFKRFQSAQPQARNVRAELAPAGTTIKPVESAKNAESVKPAENVKPKASAPNIKADSLFTSIFHSQNTVSDDNKQSTANTTPATDSNVIVKPVTDDLLQYHWTAFAASLQREDSPLKNRMCNCKPIMISESSFMIQAGNPMMAQEIETARQRILDYLRKAVSYPTLQMNIQIDEERHVEHILSRDQQYARMKESNAALAELDRVFNLELR